MTDSSERPATVRVRVAVDSVGLLGGCIGDADDESDERRLRRWRDKQYRHARRVQVLDLYLPRPLPPGPATVAGEVAS